VKAVSSFGKMEASSWKFMEHEALTPRLGLLPLPSPQSRAASLGHPLGHSSVQDRWTIQGAEASGALQCSPGLQSGSLHIQRRRLGWGRSHCPFGHTVWLLPSGWGEFLSLGLWSVITCRHTQLAHTHTHTHTHALTFLPTQINVLWCLQSWEVIR
jgi:hypothetical protein